MNAIDAMTRSATDDAMNGGLELEPNIHWLPSMELVLNFIMYWFRGFLREI